MTFDLNHDNTGCLQGDYTGHDWFVSTVFLLMAGNRDKAWTFLHNFSSLLASGYLWMPRLHASVSDERGVRGHFKTQPAVGLPVFKTIATAQNRRLRVVNRRLSFFEVIPKMLGYMHL